LEDKYFAKMGESGFMNPKGSEEESRGGDDVEGPVSRAIL
jgi:hypothetical protein